MTRASTEYRYNRLTWPEMNEAIATQKLVILPTASTEQHGKHLPLDVDTFLCESVCLEVGRRAADKVLVLPPTNSVVLGLAALLGRKDVHARPLADIEPYPVSLRPQRSSRKGMPGRESYPRKSMGSS